MVLSKVRSNLSITVTKILPQDNRGGYVLALFSGSFLSLYSSGQSSSSSLLVHIQIFEDGAIHGIVDVPSLKEGTSSSSSSSSPSLGTYLVFGHRKLRVITINALEGIVECLTDTLVLGGMVQDAKVLPPFCETPSSSEGEGGRNTSLNNQELART